MFLCTHVFEEHGFTLPLSFLCDLESIKVGICLVVEVFLLASWLVEWDFIYIGLSCRVHTWSMGWDVWLYSWKNWGCIRGAQFFISIHGVPISAVILDLSNDTLGVDDFEGFFFFPYWGFLQGTPCVILC